MSPVFDKFVEKSPISVMSRAMIERAFSPDQLNQWLNQFSGLSKADNLRSLAEQFYPAISCKT